MLVCIMLSPILPSTTKIEFCEFKPAGGFPNPCEDYLSKPISLDELLINRPSSTFMFKVAGNSMFPTIPEDSMIVVDRSVEIQSGKIVLATIDGQFVVKELQRANGKIIFHSHNSDYKDIEINSTEENLHDGIVWGVVTSVIKKL